MLINLIEIICFWLSSKNEFKLNLLTHQCLGVQKIKIRN